MKLADFKKIVLSTDMSSIKDETGLVLLQLHATFGAPIGSVKIDNDTVILCADDNLNKN